MNSFSKLSTSERKEYFEVAARKTGFSEQILEKDFWVCWTLKRLFSMPGIGDSLVFKGGTSLSKVFNLIERFSEDIDISIDKKTFGFSEDQDPEKAGSANKQQILLSRLSQACQAFVKERLIEELVQDFKRHIDSVEKWSLDLDPTDPDGQTILFKYPSAFKSTGYIREIIKIEMGARSDHWPTHMAHIQPYIAESFSELFTDPDAKVKVLDATRTFWEKATILHMYANYPESKTVSLRQSRHYYDFYRLINSKYEQEALSKLDLLKRVAEHKNIYFRAAWAKYPEAANLQTLNLIPNDRVLEIMKRDYDQMSEMFFGSRPDWDQIVNSISEFQKKLRTIK